MQASVHAYSVRIPMQKAMVVRCVFVAYCTKSAQSMGAALGFSMGIGGNGCQDWHDFDLLWSSWPGPNCVAAAAGFCCT
jgi:hypothetical protein